MVKILFTHLLPHLHIEESGQYPSLFNLKTLLYLLLYISCNGSIIFFMYIF